MSEHKTITVAPTALDRNGVGAALTLVSGALEFNLDGDLASGLDRNGIAAAQTPGSASDLTLNGALASGGEVGFATATRISFYAANDESGKTFTITGKIYRDGSGGIHTISETVTGPTAGEVVFSTTGFNHIDSIAASAATTGDVEVGVNGTVTFATPQHITAYAGADESGKTITFTGTDRNGLALTETITGPDTGTVVSTKNFKTLTQVVGSAATAGDIEIGVDGTAESGWFPVNYRGPDFNIGFGVDLSSDGNLTYTVQHTFHDVLASGFAEDDATKFNHESIAAKTVAADGNYTNPPTALRLAITAHTAGSANLRVVQTGRS